MNLLAQLQAASQCAAVARPAHRPGSKAGQLLVAMADGQEWSLYRAADEMGWPRPYASAVLCALHHSGRIECVRRVPQEGRPLKIYRRTSHA